MRATTQSPLDSVRSRDGKRRVSGPVARVFVAVISLSDGIHAEKCCACIRSSSTFILCANPVSLGGPSVIVELARWYGVADTELPYRFDRD